MSSSKSDLVINAFEGAITVSNFHAPNRDRAFYFDVTFILDHPHLVKLASAAKPPLHFHPYQEEYLEVREGKLGVEVQGKEYILTPEDGEFIIRAWTNHRLYPIMPEKRTGELPIARFLLSGESTKDSFKLDTMFFENWYGYQDAVVIGGEKIDLIQMFDAGGSYLSFPNWVPFGERLAQAMGIVMGRWMGGLLGYQPFHKKWTSDWGAACEKMVSLPFLKRFAQQAKEE